MPTLESMIKCRQFTSLTNFVAHLKENSARKLVFDEILDSNSDFVNHYVNLLTDYRSKYEIQEEQKNNLKRDVNNLAQGDGKSKYKL